MWILDLYILKARVKLPDNSRTYFTWLVIFTPDLDLVVVDITDEFTTSMMISFEDEKGRVMSWMTKLRVSIGSMD